MCHRYFQAHQSAKVAERYSAKLADRESGQLDSTGQGTSGNREIGRLGEAEAIPPEVFPGHQSVIVLSDKGERIVTMMHWGFIPSWVKDEDMAAYDKPNNARSETVIRNLGDGRGMYHRAMQSGRCILSASGWCEWTGEKGSKVAHQLRVRGEEFVSFAGLYTYRAGFPGFSCTMLTTAAKGKAAEFHQRIPVVLLSRADEDRWLDPASEPKSLIDLFECIPDELLEVAELDEPPRAPRGRRPSQGDLFSF